MSGSYRIRYNFKAMSKRTTFEAIFLLLEENQQITKRHPSEKLNQTSLTNKLNVLESSITDDKANICMTRTAQQIAGIDEAFE